MAQFEGSKSQVRCVDCSKLADKYCTVKAVKVAPKKKRSCSLYDFTGIYSNREGVESIYVPHVDKKTRKMIKKLLGKGALPVAGDGSVEIRDGFVKVKDLPMPVSTATVPVLKTKDNEDFYAPALGDQHPLGERDPIPQ